MLQAKRLLHTGYEDLTLESWGAEPHHTFNCLRVADDSHSGQRVTIIKEWGLKTSILLDIDQSTIYLLDACRIFEVRLIGTHLASCLDCIFSPGFPFIRVETLYELWRGIRSDLTRISIHGPLSVPGCWSAVETRKGVARAPREVPLCSRAADPRTVPHPAPPRRRRPLRPGR